MFDYEQLLYDSLILPSVKQMLAHLSMLVSKEYLAIPKEFDKLIISLRTAYANELSLDKEQTSYSDSTTP